MRSKAGWIGAGALALAVVLAATGCRCGSSVPGTIGKAAGALDAVPADVDAVIVVNTAGLRQGSLGQYVYAPWVVRQFEEWGGAPCAALPATLADTAAFGMRSGRAGGGGDEFFFAVDGPTIDDVKRCLDEHARRQGLSSSYESVGGLRALTDGRGLHVLAAGPKVVARSFPFNKMSVLEEMAAAASARAPALAGSASFRELLTRLGGDVTVALSGTRALLDTYGRGLEESITHAVPPGWCASPTEIGLVLAMAQGQGFGQLPGIDAVLKSKFAGLSQVCLTDVVAETFRTIGRVRSAGIALTGRSDLDLALLLVFDDPAPAAEVRGVLADLIHVLEVLPAQLDVIERDWPVAIGWLQRRVDLPTLREALRNPALKHLTVGGDGDAVELRLHIDQADVHGAIEATQQTVAKLVAKE